MPPLRLSLLVLGFVASPFAAAQGDIRPGAWDMSVEFSVPADPAFKQPAISRRQCLTAADARDPGRMLAEMSVPGATGCAISDKGGSSGHLEFDVKCEGIFAIGGHGAVDYTPETLQGTLNLDFKLGDTQSAKRTGSVSRIAAHRVGDC
jgi:hypothetical protein